VVYFVSLVAEPRASQATDISLSGYDVEMGFFELMVFSLFTHWAGNSLVSYSLQALCERQKVSIGHRNPAKSQVSVTRDDLARLWTSGVLGVTADDGFPWRYD
jgi:hypothetical protein